MKDPGGCSLQHCRIVSLVAGVLGVGVWFGCARSALSRGVDCYAQKRYIDAAQIFEHNEQELSEYDAADRARYGVYRGLTLIALGDEAAGRHWLHYGTALARRSLSKGERAQMTTAAAAFGASPATVEQ
jgi:hypothetical protein